ncbi:hypothetical protein [Methanobrevibacter sp.]|uniref:hypothetical protein n=1 Tax=Methanobrevibacter sp. TaxID=66852 RepID=UPI00389030E6
MISDVSGGTLGVSLDDVSNDTLSVSNDEQILAVGNSWYVNASNTGPDRDGSQSNPFNNLNETFNSPNLNDGDTIYIAGGTYTGEKNTNLEINKKLNLVNWGNDEVIFDAQYLSNIFTINVNEFNVTGITFKNGNNTNLSSYGGEALFFAYGLINSHIDATFINNTVTVNEFNACIGGGAICFMGNVDNCTFNSKFEDNSMVSTIAHSEFDAVGGGAICFIGNVTNSIFNSEFINNTFLSDKYSFCSGGGAIFFARKDTKVKNVTFNGKFINNSVNAPNAWGGAIDLLSEVIDSNFNAEFTGNYINGDDGAGGAIAILSNIINTNMGGIFKNNIIISTTNYYLYGGGALYFYSSLYKSNITGVFVGNIASFGGSLYFRSASDINKINATFINNTAYYGGAVYYMDTFTNTNISGRFINNKAANGGAIFIKELSFFVSIVDSDNIDAEFINNSAVRYGGAICIAKIIENSNISGTFKNNTASIGGAIYIYTDRYWKNNKINANFIGNNATKGAAIFTDSDSVNNEINSNFIDNSANEGATIYINGNSQDDSIFNSLFVNNTANSIIYVENGNTKIYDNIFLNNEKDYDIVSSIDNFDMLNVTNNWFGHNATNYEDGPSIDGPINCDTWLFLNATADPESITYLETSEITFNLFVYNNKTGSTNEKYDDTRLEPVNLTITSTNGDVDKKTAKFGDILIFTPTLCGTGSVTASVEDAYDTIELEITKVDPGLSVVVDPYEIDYGDNATISLSYNEYATGTVNITLIGEKQNYTFTDIPLNETITISDTIMPVEYKVSVSYSGDDNFNNVTKNSEDNLIVNDIEILVDSLTKYYHGKEALNVSVVNSKGNPSPNKTVEITINGVTYNRTTDENGNAVLNINLNPGEYPVTVAFKDKSTDATVTVLPTINATDLEKVVLSDRQFYATFLDSEGNYLKNGTAVKFNIHGIEYTRYVSGDKGLAKLNINLIQGDYVITSINLVTGDMLSNNISVIPRIIENYDITKYFRNGTIFSVKIIDDDYKVAGAGIAVTYNIHGVFYTRYTDSDGIARLNITLEPGEYIITSECKGCMVSNTVTVLPVLIADDVTMKYGDGTKFVAKLLDGQGNAFPNQKLNFNLFGVLNEAITDSNGIARIPITLQPGEYLMTSTYGGNGALAVNKITITS